MTEFLNLKIFLIIDVSYKHVLTKIMFIMKRELVQTKQYNELSLKI